MQRLLREPLVWFFSLAGLLFALFGARAPLDPVVVSRAQVSAALAAKLGRAPSAAELEAEVALVAEREALVLEARRLGVADDDPIVKRRLVQKMEQLAEDLATLRPPDEAALAAHLAADPARYARPERRTVRQVFLPEPATEREAQAVLQALAAGADPGRLGRAFAAGAHFAAHTEAELGRRVSGPVAAAAFAAVPGRFVGPVRSVYGWHLIRVEAVEAARPAALDEVRAQVRRDLEVARRDAARVEARLRARARHPVELVP